MRREASPLPPAGNADQRRLAQEVIVRVAGGLDVLITKAVVEIIFGPAPTSQIITVTELLDVVQPAGDTAIALVVVGVEVDADPTVSAAVYFRRVEDLVQLGSTTPGFVRLLQLMKK